MAGRSTANLVVHADLGSIATGHCNDMVVDDRGNAYVGNFGYDFETPGTPFETADLALVRPDGSVEVAAGGLSFPNGSVITPDGSTLIVGESFGADYVAFDIADDATLSNRRVWASVPGMAPDGCALDADGAIWFSDAVGSQVVRVDRGRHDQPPDHLADADLRLRPRWRRPGHTVRAAVRRRPIPTTSPARRSARSSRSI